MNKELKKRLLHVAFAQPQRNRGREVRTGALAPKSDALGVATQSYRFAPRPTKGRYPVFKTCRERMLGGKSVGHRQYGAAGELCQVPMHGIVCFEIAQEPPATVEKDQQGQLAISRWSIQPNGYPISGKIAHLIELSTRELFSDDLHIRAKGRDRFGGQRRQRLRISNQGRDVLIKHGDYFLLNDIDVNGLYAIRSGREV
jgi:hypothetical protein